VQRRREHPNASFPVCLDGIAQIRTGLPGQESTVRNVPGPSTETDSPVRGIAHVRTPGGGAVVRGAGVPVLRAAGLGGQCQCQWNGRRDADPALQQLATILQEGGVFEGRDEPVPVVQLP